MAMIMPQGGGGAFLVTGAVVGPALAQKKYDPGACDSEIKLGQTMPYSGPLSGFITLAKAEIAYFQMINDQGGVNGRKITMISLDDGFSPPKTVEQTRQPGRGGPGAGDLGLARHGDERLGPEVPQRQEGAAALPGDRAPAAGTIPKNFPYTMTLTPIYQAEARIYAAYMLKEVKDPRVAVLYQNDDFGKDFLEGLPRRLGDKAASIIAREVSYEVTDADRRLADHRPRLDQGQRLPQHHDAEIRRAGDPQGARARLEAGAVHRQSGGLDRHRHAAGRHRGVQGHHLGGASSRTRPIRSTRTIPSSRPGWRG